MDSQAFLSPEVLQQLFLYLSEAFENGLATDQYIDCLTQLEELAFSMGCDQHSWENLFSRM